MSRWRRAPPTEQVEQLDVRTGDGWSLRAEVIEPPGPLAGTAVLAHALMARRSEFDRPRGHGVARLLADRGWRVIAFDFRGHGDSAPPIHQPLDYEYDDFVFEDLPTVFAFAQARSDPAERIVLVGHSLGGHVGLAAQGAGRVAFDAIVAVASDVWLREMEPSAARWLAKRGALEATLAICRRVGHFPARALRLGSDDETSALFDDFDRYARTGAWLSSDGRVDYLAGLSQVRVPVLQVVTDGDRFQCPPDCGARFIARCGGRREATVLRVSHGDAGGPPPTHMGLVTDTQAKHTWARVEAWMRAGALARVQSA